VTMTQIHHHVPHAAHFTHKKPVLNTILLGLYTLISHIRAHSFKLVYKTNTHRERVPRGLWESKILPKYDIGCPKYLIYIRPTRSFTVEDGG